MPPRSAPPSSSQPNAILRAAVTVGALFFAAFGRRSSPADRARELVDARTEARLRERVEAGDPEAVEAFAARQRDRRRRRQGTGQDRTDPYGHGAERPSDIPARGWWSILRRTVDQVNEDRVLTEAAGITFYSLLAIFPGIAALVSIYGLMADPADVNRQLSNLTGVVPGGGMEIIEEQVTRVASQTGGALGFGAIFGLLVSLWSANQGMKALFDALNIVFKEEEKRGFIYRTLLTLAFTLGAILFLALAMASVVVLPIVLNFVGLSGQADLLIRLARWPLMLVVIALFLAAVYRYGPSREKAKWRWVSWGAAFAALIWLAGSIAFSWYVANFGNYNETYGSLGAVIGFMTWIWLSSAVILIGAELDSEMERQTARDTTKPPEKPLGLRGARMADTVAAEPR